MQYVRGTGGDRQVGLFPAVELDLSIGRPISWTGWPPRTVWGASGSCTARRQPVGCTVPGAGGNIKGTGGKFASRNAAQTRPTLETPENQGDSSSPRQTRHPPLAPKPNDARSHETPPKARIRTSPEIYGRRRPTQPQRTTSSTGRLIQRPRFSIAQSPASGSAASGSRSLPPGPVRSIRPPATCGGEAGRFARSAIRAGTGQHRLVNLRQSGTGTVNPDFLTLLRKHDPSRSRRSLKPCGRGCIRQSRGCLQKP